MPLPDDAVSAIERFCEEQTPPSHRDQMRLEAEVRDNMVTIGDCRPPWDGEPGEWTRTDFAQLRYEPTARRWTLYWADSDDRWHRYEDLPPSQDVTALLAEIAKDPTNIFFG